MTNRIYTHNLKRGDEGGQVYWRALWALEADPIASMFSERTLKGLADGFYAGMVDSDNKAKFNPTGARVWAGEVINKSPMSVLSTAAQKHLVRVIYDGMFPEGIES